MFVSLPSTFAGNFIFFKNYLPALLQKQVFQDHLAQIFSQSPRPGTKNPWPKCSYYEIVGKDTGFEWDMTLGNPLPWKSPDFFANWHLITNIILNDAQVLLGCQHISVLGFDKHFHAWSIELEEKFFIHPAKFKSLEEPVFIKNRRKLFVNYDWIK